MKKLLAFLLILYLLPCSFAFAGEEDDLLAGDVTQDGVTDGRDVIRLLKKLNKEYVEVNLPVADVTGDAVVDSKDVEVMLNAMADNPETKMEKPVDRDIKIVYTSKPDSEKTTINLVRCCWNLGGSPDPDQLKKVEDAINHYIADKIKRIFAFCVICFGQK